MLTETLDATHDFRQTRTSHTQMQQVTHDNKDQDSIKGRTKNSTQQTPSPLERSTRPANPLSN